MILLKQCSPAWKNTKLGQSRWTICQKGCVVTSLSMLSDYFRSFKDPNWMAKNLKFTKSSVPNLDGLLLWGSINTSALPFNFEWRSYGLDENRINEALKNPNKAALLNVNGGSHWVLATSKIFFLGMFGYIAADPETGTRHFFSKKSITGSSIMVKK